MQSEKQITTKVLTCPMTPWTILAPTCSKYLHTGVKTGEFCTSAQRANGEFVLSAMFVQGVDPPLHQVGGHVASCRALHHAAQANADVSHEGLIKVQRLLRVQSIMKRGFVRTEPTCGVWQRVQGGQGESLQVWAGGGGGGGGDNGGGDGL